MNYFLFVLFLIGVIFWSQAFYPFTVGSPDNDTSLNQSEKFCNQITYSVKSNRFKIALKTVLSVLVKEYDQFIRGIESKNSIKLPHTETPTAVSYNSSDNACRMVERTC